MQITINISEWLLGLGLPCAALFFGMDAIFHWALVGMIFCGISFAVLCVTRRINPIRFLIEQHREENFRRRLIAELKKVARAQKR